MADETPAPAPTPADNQAQFIPQAVYIKDVSFEVPQGPRQPPNGTNPNVDLNLNTNVSQLGPNLFEVVLKVNLQSKVSDKTLWLCEIQQAGAFTAQNIPDADLARIFGTFCPTYLLPYARQTIADLLLKGGIQPFLLPPVNFEALFEQAQSDQARKAADGAAPPASVN